MTQNFIIVEGKYLEQIIYNLCNILPIISNDNLLVYDKIDIYNSNINIEFNKNNYYSIGTNNLSFLTIKNKCKIIMNSSKYNSIYKNIKFISGKIDAIIDELKDKELQS